MKWPGKSGQWWESTPMWTANVQVMTEESFSLAIHFLLLCLASGRFYFSLLKWVKRFWKKNLSFFWYTLNSRYLRTWILCMVVLLVTILMKPFHRPFVLLMDAFQPCSVDLGIVGSFLFLYMVLWTFDWACYFHGLTWGLHVDLQ